MSITSLPEELLDQIFSMLIAIKDEDVEHFPLDIIAQVTYAEQEILRALCLTCRTFLPLARRLLYRQIHINEGPRRGRKAMWSDKISLYRRAGELLVSLQANDGNLGKLVRSLKNLVTWSNQVESQDIAGHLFEEDGGGGDWNAVTKWFLGMLAACPSLVEVQLYFESNSQLSLVAQALEPSTSTLRTLFFTNPTFRKDGLKGITSTLVHSALSDPVFENVNTLHLAEIIDCEQSSTQSMMHELNSLTIFTYNIKTTFDNQLQYLPGNIPRLRRFHLSPASMTPAEMSTAIVHLPSTIRELEFSLTYGNHEAPPYPDPYSTPSPLPAHSSVASNFRGAIGLPTLPRSAARLAEAILKMFSPLTEFSISSADFLDSPISI
ncbi:hypothetical protein JCM5350_006573 [Sporobolomyces pararoseus]